MTDHQKSHQFNGHMKSRRKAIFISAVFLGVVSIIFFFYVVNRQNKIRVTVGDGLSIDKVKIELGFYSISSDSDEGLVKSGLQNVVFLQKPKNGFETICGENDFYITYDNTYYAIVRHFIPNDFVTGVPKPHSYNFNFQRLSDSLYVTIEIEGEHPETFKRALQEVRHANDNLWGKRLKAAVR